MRFNLYRPIVEERKKPNFFRSMVLRQLFPLCRKGFYYDTMRKTYKCSFAELMFLRELRSEKIARVPHRAFGLLRHLVADEE